MIVLSLTLVLLLQGEPAAQTTSAPSVPAQASAAESPPVPVPAPAPAPKPRITRPAVLTSVDPAYSQADRDAGRQGEVELSGVVQADGTLTEAQVAKGSGVPEFDQAALDAFRRWTFRPGLDADGKPAALPVRAKIEFYKDHVIGLEKKTCADFSTDVAWFRATFPDRKASDMRLYAMSLGLFTLAAAGKGGSQTLLTLIKRFEPAWEKTVEQCGRKPNARFLDTLAKAL